MPTTIKSRTHFDSRQMKRMTAVGAVTDITARIWLRSDIPGEVSVSIQPYGKPALRREIPALATDSDADLTHTVLITDLSPLTEYRYDVRRVAGNRLIGRGRFETFPADDADTPEKVSIALTSCHQPFGDDGKLCDKRMRLLKLMPAILRENDVKFILLAGDQIYSDIPSDRSLFYRHYTKKWNHPAGDSILDWGSPTVRQAFQERYRIFWEMKEMHSVYANYPCYPILDDHEIMDDWGAVNAHSTQKFARLRKGAREAYFDYQGSRVAPRKKRLPASFDYSFSYGNIGVFVFDLRSQRRAGKHHRLYGNDQYARFRTFLTRNQHKAALLIMVSVPVVHLPEWLSDVGAALLGHKVDFPDHWSYHKNRPDRNRLLSALYRHKLLFPDQKIILVSGDVHIGCAFSIEWTGQGNRPVIYQFTSSAVSNRTKKIFTEFLKAPLGLAGEIHLQGGTQVKTRLLDPSGNMENPFGGLNIGMIDITRSGGTTSVQLRLAGYEEGASSYRDFFRSRPL